MACTSDKGTAHVFSLCASESEMSEIEPSSAQTEESDIEFHRRDSLLTKSDKNTQKNKESVLKFMKRVLPKYFSSEWSFAQIKIGGPKEKESM